MSAHPTPRAETTIPNDPRPRPTGGAFSCPAQRARCGIPQMEDAAWQRSLSTAEAGTTGLQIRDRLQGRSDVSLISLDGDRRKDRDARAEAFREADVSILCLPDDAAIEAVALAGGEGQDHRRLKRAPHGRWLGVRHARASRRARCDPRRGAGLECRLLRDGLYRHAPPARGCGDHSTGLRCRSDGCVRLYRRRQGDDRGA